MWTRTLLLGLPLAGLALGCASDRNEIFNINVHNSTTRPVMLSLAKAADGGREPGPYEAEWASPEDVALESPSNREKWALATLPPGHDAVIKDMKGKFDSYTHAMLRVYAGEMTISQMLARGAGNPERLDIPLTPGSNAITLSEKAGSITAMVDQTAPPRK